MLLLLGLTTHYRSSWSTKPSSLPRSASYTLFRDLSKIALEHLGMAMLSSNVLWISSRGYYINTWLDAYGYHEPWTRRLRNKHNSIGFIIKLSKDKSSILKITIKKKSLHWIPLKFCCYYWSWVDWLSLVLPYNYYDDSPQSPAYSNLKLSAVSYVYKTSCYHIYNH